ncbi:MULTISPECIES: GSCFA domain-containing protein [unclassified Methylobacterium]|uniref:GSCFA domain-containing protein n=1 Tax=unclassified Methylobacterium TaxID=2615210 RepID=UPI0006F7D05F|nr:MULTISPECIES: GSCFA domain-containing protein [unclassified Methylobacterium]KQP52620.1 GSCFA domain-containing protein [Methylobacterium sp. Leaf108]KQT84333.1 GSCFA domain-containing protein [Methylobacterium sp. Leaf466]
MASDRPTADPFATNPYSALPDRRSWRKAVAGTPPFALDPTGAAGFRLTRTERIATAGSCFAQHVARALKAEGFNFLVVETPSAGTATTASADGEGDFSARYGNIYTTRQLVQLFERAFGTFAPRLEAWQRADGRFVDPFRPRIDPAGHESPEAVATAREVHLAHVRTLFQTLDTLVFTLGLTEGWRDSADGAALPLPPGVAGGIWDPAEVGFANAGVAEMTADMLAFVDALRGVNPAARVILTVSPVPLAMTYADRHVLVANAYSKAALRVVAEEVCAARPEVFYFPSYEIVTAPTTQGRYFADNLRAVTPAGVAHVMRCFMAHAAHEGARAEAPRFDVRSENQRTAKVVCDEELLDS